MITVLRTLSIPFKADVSVHLLFFFSFIQVSQILKEKILYLDKISVYRNPFGTLLGNVVSKQSRSPVVLFFLHIARTGGFIKKTYDQRYTVEASSSHN